MRWTSNLAFGHKKTFGQQRNKNMSLTDRLKRRLRPSTRAIKTSIDPSWGRKSYSQFGEDVIFEYYFKWRGIANPRYLDVGAFDPIFLSNTYRLYEDGGSGVLIEPSPDGCEKLRHTRPRDTVLNCAVRTQDMPSTVDFYQMSAPAISTIVKREAKWAEDSQAWGVQKIVGTIAVPAYSINEILDRYFPSGVDLIDIDVEGLDFEIMSEIDFERHRPGIICIEIHGGHYAEAGKDGTIYTKPKEMFIEFMKCKGYQLFVPIVLNGIFVRE
jgi:FkbM family methyltransferase